MVETEAVGVELEVSVLGQDTGGVAGMTRVTNGTGSGGLAQGSRLSVASSAGCLDNLEMLNKRKGAVSIMWSFVFVLVLVLVHVLFGLALDSLFSFLSRFFAVIFFSFFPNPYFFFA
jgi:hypothetical protein